MWENESKNALSHLVLRAHGYVFARLAEWSKALVSGKNLCLFVITSLRARSILLCAYVRTTVFIGDVRLLPQRVYFLLRADRILFASAE